MSELLSDTVSENFVVQLHQYNETDEDQVAEVSMARRADIIRNMADSWFASLQSMRCSLGSNQLCYTEMDEKYWLEVSYQKSEDRIGETTYDVAEEIPSLAVVHRELHPDTSTLR